LPSHHNHEAFAEEIRIRARLQGVPADLRAGSEVQDAFGRGIVPGMSSVLLQLLGGTKSSHALRRWVNLWPPFLGAGIRVVHIAPDMKSVDVEMKLRFWNANYVGTHFGGSLFAMTDAFYMLMLMANLGRDYIVWDKAATIRYRKPGRGTVRAEFRLSDSQIDDIREKLKTVTKYEPAFLVEVKDQAGVLIAEVEKVLHVRKRQESASGK
jgi:acyl-coenzyme A thioesterase PaaI-like protein